MRCCESGKRWRLRLLSLLMIGFMMAMLPASADAAKKKYYRSFFNTIETRSKDQKQFKKWRSALARYSKEAKGNKEVKCNSKRLNICDYGDWKKFLISIKKFDKYKQLRAVNSRMNKARYTTDKTNWGKKDYWATPGEFMSRFGDCEDYAIVKYLSLRMLGFKDRELRVVAVKDLNLKVGHAVLVAILKDAKTKKKKYYLLDNQIKRVVETKTVRHYEPVFSINKSHWWRHRRKK